MGFKENLKVENTCNNDCYKVYDSNGKHIKNIKVEDEKNLKDEYLYGVTCFVVNEENKVLMEVRANTELTPGKIDLVSGHVNGNEVGIQAIIRELNEEVGIKNINNSNLYKVSDSSKPLGFESKGKIHNFFIDFYCLKTKKCFFEIQEEEVKSLKWVDMEKAFEMIKTGKTKFPKQNINVNYDKIFDKVRKFCLVQREKSIGEN